MVENWINAHAEQAQVALFFALFALFALAELVEPKRRTPMRRKERWTANLLLTAINIAAMSFLPVSFLSAALWAQNQGWGLFNAAILPTATLVAATLLIRAFISFFTHYLMHRIPLFWRVHRVHHLDTELDVTTTVRFHPLEFAIALIPGLPLVIAFGLAPWVLLLYEVFDAGITVFSHANMRLSPRLEKWLHYLVVTPDLHRVHHSAQRSETNSNYGAVFPLWDLVFGTFRTRTDQEHMQLGLAEVRDPRADKVPWLLLSPLFARLSRD